MPLLKLWNAIWGRSVEENRVAEGTTVVPAVAAENCSETTVAKSPRAPSKRSSGKAQVETRTQPASKSQAVSGRSAGFGFSLFSSNPHSGLCKLVAATQARSVLEVKVGDGSRAIAVMEALAKQGAPVRYFGIDQFELSGGQVTLRDFHCTLRAAGIRPQLFPETVDRGLVRFLHTVGRADLVLLSEPNGILDDLRVRQLLARVSHSETTILAMHNAAWSRLPLESNTAIRRAA